MDFCTHSFPLFANYASAQENWIDVRNRAVCPLSKCMHSTKPTFPHWFLSTSNALQCMAACNPARDIQKVTWIALETEILEGLKACFLLLLSLSLANSSFNWLEWDSCHMLIVGFSNWLESSWLGNQTNYMPCHIYVPYHLCWWSPAIIV